MLTARGAAQPSPLHARRPRPPGRQPPGSGDIHGCEPRRPAPLVAQSGLYTQPGGMFSLVAPRARLERATYCLGDHFRPHLTCCAPGLD
jgi:hypothetical protein